MPDIFGSPSSLASLAASHALVCIPRNGVFSSVKRQADLAKQAIIWMKNELFLKNNKNKNMKTKIICILDRSPSMNSIIDEAIIGFNQFIDEQKLIENSDKDIIKIIQFDK